VKYNADVDRTPYSCLNGYFTPCEWPLQEGCDDKAWIAIEAAGGIVYLLCLKHVEAETFGELGCS